MSRTIKVESDIPAFADVDGDSEMRLPLAKVIEALQRALLEVPAAYRDRADFQVKGYGDYPSVYVKVIYDRPENDDERRAREQAVQRSLTEAEARERAQYARLKEKYG